MTESGFLSPAIDAASAFRTILLAMSRPGTILPLSPPVSPPLPLLPGAAVTALTLCDFQTPVWLAPAIATPAVKQFLRFQTGAPLTDELAEAAFAFMPAGEGMPILSRFAQGTHEYPDRSATLVLQVEALRSDGSVELSGPGIPSPLRFGVPGLGAEFWHAMADNHTGFPIGVDVIFVSPTGIAAVPRSTEIVILESF